MDGNSVTQSAPGFGRSTARVVSLPPSARRTPSLSSLELVVHERSNVADVAVSNDLGERLPSVVGRQHTCRLVDRAEHLHEAAKVINGLNAAKPG
ncbi:hypothetical protein [Mesorhizobium escarrei]|uniref:hypothetical protein n=1 Tax=Mesorhizobium escarrei TaxID=666018 RepID=UPI0020A7E92A|nr:hypothetical protein [Mesorhizobium escarrei]